MKVHRLSETNSVLNSFLFEIRDQSIHHDSMRFRRNIERIGEIISYEMSKSFSYRESIAGTPLGKKSVMCHNSNLVVCSILRAGLPLQSGLLNYFDGAESAFISAYRKHDKNGNGFKIEVEYVACPDLTDKTLVLVDPMLATGQSLVLTYDTLMRYGIPKAVHLVSVIGAVKGVEFVSEHFPDECHLWIADIDEQLDDKGYIVPGLGDAGDLAFGEKIQR